VDVDGCVCEELAVALAVDGAGQEDAPVSGGFGLDGGDERVGIGRAAEEDERRRSGDAPVGAHDGVGVVLGLETRDVEDVAAGRKAKAIERGRPGGLGQIGAVRDEERLLAVRRAVVSLDRARVRHEHVRQHAAEPFGDRVREAARRVPLSPVAFEAVDVQDDAGSGAEEAREPAREGVHAVAHEDGVVPLGGGVEAGERRVDDGLEVLALDRR
jgi:hypothetical protein